MSIVCAIHQPNFFPWLGYFDKIQKADIFVFLDDVQNQKTGSSWTNRTKLNCFGKEKWYTCPIKRAPGLMKINEIEFAINTWTNDFLNVLQNYYKKYPSYEKTIKLIKQHIFKKEYTYLAELNRDVIILLSDYLGYKTSFVNKSQLSVQTHSTQMLVDICKAVGADAYLCGGGAHGYQIDSLFPENGLKLLFQNFTPMTYFSPDFIGGLSVIDYLMSV